MKKIFKQDKELLRNTPVVVYEDEEMGCIVVGVVKKRNIR